MLVSIFVSLLLSVEAFELCGCPLTRGGELDGLRNALRIGEVVKKKGSAVRFSVQLTPLGVARGQTNATARNQSDKPQAGLSAEPIPQGTIVAKVCYYYFCLRIKKSKRLP